MDVMQPYHPDWQAFCERLSGPEGCDFQDDKVKGFTWCCGGGKDQSRSRAILETMDVDVDKSLEVFSAAGGHCDCEVLFNVEDSFGRWFPADPTLDDIDAGLEKYRVWLAELLAEHAESLNTAEGDKQ